MKNKPCPWCGSINLSACLSELPNHGAVFCECGIHGPEVRIFIRWTDKKKSKAVFDAWNNREIDK